MHNLILPVEEPKAEPDEDAGRKAYPGSEWVRGTVSYKENTESRGAAGAALNFYKKE